MNDQPVPMDLSRGHAPNQGNWRRPQGQWQNQGQRQWGPPRQGPKGNIAQTTSTNNACFNCGKNGHFARNCPERRQQRANANLIEFDGFQDDPEQQMGEPVDRIARIRAELDALSPDEAKQVAQQMGVAEDFLQV